ncbi:MAG: hypothetical protein HY367_04120 [Candidatus Aenigmarchaeota archaeon]|nr:hypothetical protein [Candidatus Aenigmarchaeota archaeon]
MILIALLALVSIMNTLSTLAYYDSLTGRYLDGSPGTECKTGWCSTEKCCRGKSILNA